MKKMLFPIVALMFFAACQNPILNHNTANMLPLAAAFTGSTYWSSAGPTAFTLVTTGDGYAEYSSNEFVSDPFSIELNTDLVDDHAEIIFENGPQLKDISELSYWAYTEKTSFGGDFYGGILRPYLAIYLHESPDKSLEDWYVDIGTNSAYYIQAEPVYTDILALTIQTWENWDAYDDVKPLRWVGNESPDLPYVAPSLIDYISGTAMNYPTYAGDQAFASREYGNLYIVAIKVRAGYGGPWTDFNSYVDDVVINDYTEDFGHVDVEVDVKPGSYPNSINLKSKGKTPVAILTSSEFNASQVNPSTIVFAGATPVKWSVSDVNKDGAKDLLLHFSTQELDLVDGDTEATLTGWTMDRIPISGKDSVRTVPKK